MHNTRTKNQYSGFFYSSVFADLDDDALQASYKKMGKHRVPLSVPLSSSFIFYRGLRLGIPNPIHKWSSSIKEFEHETGAASTHDREVNS